MAPPDFIVHSSKVEIVQSDGVLGAVEISTFLGLVLYGVSLSQGYTYFRRNGEDRKALKALVYIVLILESLHSFTAAMAIYYDTVTRWKSAQENSYPIASNALFETLITVVVQTYFSFRVYKLSQSPYIGMVCASMALLRFVGGAAVSVETFLDVPNNPNGGPLVVHFSRLITSALAIGGAADVLIAIYMTYYLRKLASPTNLKSTTDFLNRLVRWSLQTGLITSMTSVAVIISFQAVPNMIWFGLYMILAKIYSNSLLTSLNARPRDSQVTSTDRINTELQFDRSRRRISISFQVQRSQSDEPVEWKPSPPSNSKDEDVSF